MSGDSQDENFWRNHANKKSFWETERLYSRKRKIRKCWHVPLYLVERMESYARDCHKAIKVCVTNAIRNANSG